MFKCIFKSVSSESNSTNRCFQQEGTIVGKLVDCRPMSVLETTTHCAVGSVVPVPEPMSVLETTTHCAVGSLVPVPEPLITADLSSWLQSPAQRPAGGGNQFDQSCTGCRLAG